MTRSLYTCTATTLTGPDVPREDSARACWTRSAGIRGEFTPTLTSSGTRCPTARRLSPCSPGARADAGWPGPGARTGGPSRTSSDAADAPTSAPRRPRRRPRRGHAPSRDRAPCATSDRPTPSEGRGHGVASLDHPSGARLPSEPAATHRQHARAGSRARRGAPGCCRRSVEPCACFVARRLALPRVLSPGSCPAPSLRVTSTPAARHARLATLCPLGGEVLLVDHPASNPSTARCACGPCRCATAGGRGARPRRLASRWTPNRRRRTRLGTTTPCSVRPTTPATTIWPPCCCAPASARPVARDLLDTTAGGDDVGPLSRSRLEPARSRAGSGGSTPDGGAGRAGLAATSLDLPSSWSHRGRVRGRRWSARTPGRGWRCPAVKCLLDVAPPRSPRGRRAPFAAASLRRYLDGRWCGRDRWAAPQLP